jgi:hypothetical protein
MATLRVFFCISIKPLWTFSKDGLVFRVARGDGSLEFIFLVVLFAIIVVIAAVVLSKAKNKVDKRHDRN